MGGRPSRSSSSALVSSMSPQVSGQGSPAPVSSSKSSFKVMCLLKCLGLGDWAHLLDDPPWYGSAWGLYLMTPSLGPLAVIPEHLWLLECQWPWLSEQLSLSIFSSNKAEAANTHWWASHTMARTSLHDPSFTSLFIHGAHYIPKYSLWVWPGGAGRALPQFLLWLVTIPPKPEVFLNRVQNFLMDPLLCLHITRVSARQPL